MLIGKHLLKRVCNIKNSKIIQVQSNTNYFKIDHNKNKFNKNIQILFPARIIKERNNGINACKQL